MTALADALSLSRSLNPPQRPELAQLRFAPVTPAAKPLIQEAMGRLSPESSRHRFFTVRRRLSEAELARLTELDGWNRYAIGASAVHPGGRLEGVGVARFARPARGSRVAEIALLVVDGWQGMGVGKRLFAMLRDAAVARGIDRLYGIVLRDNDAMLRLLRRHAPGVRFVDVGDHYEVDIPLEPRLRLV